MCKFVQVIYNPNLGLYANLDYISDIQKCYSRYAKYLQDDFMHFENDVYSFLAHTYPFFWAILTRDDEFMGFVLLDNFIGNDNCLYSAELTTCFNRQAWGDFTKYCAKIFLKKCFDELGLSKIKAQVYPDNFRTKMLLKSAGFEYETTLKAETLRKGKPQDLDVYALYRTYYYKTR
ncbi:GNAT family N-acetyltransferase [bacterium]|nr:GNAT family N-acetyltransferase [bacterium]